MIATLEELKVLGDNRGKLVALEANKQIPFDIQRIFYIYGTQEGVPRGNHAHYKTKQFLIAVSGSCKVTLDTGKIQMTFKLNKPNVGLFQDALVWGTMHDFSPDCVLLVMADTLYDATDYIHSYPTFLDKTRENG
ncbi:sugar 3,4-ketoisomerase [Sulfurimonas paralvinellae]|uniref:WxcM-like domain-containing protein n=1 Tax=Sulfurimonas paralvinellae TaxID=317658 RepID=A0A7M1BBC3_9BACT|nr:FdtA/QdtA family cupin domain-containing protein [Sulfurimonas paralvinellae]QOP46118.1 WxcM-like domain-containing protein [Sulfurimonas paralvinellae]